MRENGALRPASWEEAMGRIVAESRRILQDKGPLGIGFYTSGQLFLEEYYTLAVLGKAGIGTPHMDGNTRLCTATAGEAMKEPFGSDGQPASYTDIEHTDAIFLFGHNMPETQTVLWARILDRTRGENAPVIVCVDPRTTDVAREAERTGGVHLAPRPGTNHALMNGMVRELLANGWHDQAWVEAHTVGLEELQRIVEPWTPKRTAQVCGIDADELRRAVRIFGTSERVLSTVLQGFYQSHQATAASCHVNNLHLLRGLIGKRGCGILQMNGRPTAQNTRETGADGDLPGFRNWDNEAHVQQLADLWGVDVDVVPHWSPPTHAMQIWRYAEHGSIELLWISATNPAVSLPERKHAAANPAGPAVLRAAPYTPPLEEPDATYSLRFVTGRTVYHFHTRTRTARARQLQDAAKGHPEDPDTVNVCTALARLHEENVEKVQQVADRYGEEDVEEPERLHAEALTQTREGGVGLLRDLQDLHMMCALLESTRTIVDQAARGERDKELHAPAGASTLIVGLGILKTPGQLAVMVLSVLLLTLLASAANVAARVRQAGVTDAPPVRS
jgi:anaerobic selenocysteine-containing dehydrogenase